MAAFCFIGVSFTTIEWIGAISALIRSRLPLAYMSDGQRVPEDLHPARAHQLVARAVDLSRKSGAHADEDLLQRRFGAVAHALA